LLVPANRCLWTWHKSAFVLIASIVKLASDMVTQKLRGGNKSVPRLDSGVANGTA